MTFLMIALLQDWPQWRGPTSDGRAHPDQKPPVSWSATENVVWKADVPGRGHGSPAVVGDRVYLATCDEKAGTQSVLGFDRATGRKLWETEVHRGGAMRKNPKSTGASSSVACDGERVYVNFPNKDAVWTTALDPDGMILWSVKIGAYVIHQGYGSSPMPYRSLLLVSADHNAGGMVGALDRKTGAVVWTRERPKAPNYTTPVVLKAAGREQLFLTGCDLVSSLDPMTGKVLWEIPGATTECVTTTVTDGARIFSSGGYPRNHLAAIEADGSGKIAWDLKDRVYVPSLLVRDGHLYGTLDAGVAACWASDSGKELWKERLGGTFSASPVLAGDRIYATNEAGETFIYEASPAKFTLIAKNKLGDEALATPAICGGRIYARVAERVEGGRREALYCLGEKRD
jgi:outer membrane protein assembly factor BamB